MTLVSSIHDGDVVKPYRTTRTTIWRTDFVQRTRWHTDNTRCHYCHSIQYITCQIHMCLYKIYTLRYRANSNKYITCQFKTVRHNNDMEFTSEINQIVRKPKMTASLDSRSCHGMPMCRLSQTSLFHSSSFHAADPMSKSITFGEPSMSQRP